MIDWLAVFLVLIIFSQKCIVACHKVAHLFIYFSQYIWRGGIFEYAGQSPDEDCSMSGHLRDSASILGVTVTQACLTLFILSDPLWDMQGPLALLANTDDFMMFTLYIQESA